MEWVALELGLQNSPFGEGRPTKRDQHEPRLEAGTAQGPSRWHRALLSEARPHRVQ